MENRKIQYTYQKFKQLTESRRKMVKLFFKQKEFSIESCGKGVLKIFQFWGSNLIEIKKLEDVMPNLRDFYLLIDTAGINNNSSSELENSSKHRAVLNSENLADHILFVNLKSGTNFEQDYEDKIFRFFDEHDNELIIAFNDIIEFFTFLNTVGRYSKEIYSPLIVDITTKTIDKVLNQINESYNNSIYLEFLEKDDKFCDRFLLEIEKALSRNDNDFLTKVLTILKKFLSSFKNPDFLLRILSDKFFMIFLKIVEMEKGKKELVQNFLQIRHFELLQIKSELLELIRINYRIVFIKEVLYKELFSKEQIIDLDEFLTLHNNMIIFYFIDNLETVLANFLENFELKYDIYFQFFKELSNLIESCFPEVNLKFCKEFFNSGFPFRIIDIIFACLAMKEINFDMVLAGFKIIELFAHKQIKFVLQVFIYESVDKKSILDYLQPLCRNIETQEILMDYFNLIKINCYINIEFNEAITLFLVERLIPKLQRSLTIRKSLTKIIEDNILIKSSIEFFSNESKLLSRRTLSYDREKESKRLVKKPMRIRKLNSNFILFGLQILNSLFSLNSSTINSALIKSNLMGTLVYFFTDQCLFFGNEKKSLESKIFKIQFCTHLKYMLERSETPNDLNFDYNKALEIFWGIFTKSFSNKKSNILQSIVMSILYYINSTEKEEYLKKITLLFRTSPIKLDLEVLNEIAFKTKQELIYNSDSHLTSESETLQVNSQVLKMKLSEHKRPLNKIIKREGNKKIKFLQVFEEEKKRDLDFRDLLNKGDLSNIVNN